MTKRPGADAKPLEGEDALAYKEAMSTIKDATQKVIDGDGDLSELAALPAISSQTILNALFVPEDAGEYAAGLEAILRRIPDGWGRWIGCGRGWYPIIVKLDERLAAIDPDYEVMQVKEKFGTLRYYCTGDGEEAVFNLIMEAEQQSAVTCELCGTPGQIHERGYWLRTLCSDCAAAQGYTVPQEE